MSWDLDVSWVSLSVQVHFTRGEKQYLQVGVVDRERRAEETLDNGHHCLCYIFLQGRISMVTICSGIANLKCKNQEVNF